MSETYGDFSAGVEPLPEPSEPAEERQPIDELEPDSDLHQQVLDQINKRITASERAMANFHKRWQVAERRFMAYINMQDFEALAKDTNEKGEPPQLVSICVPYSYATVWTIVTFLLHTFCGRKPIFQVGTHKREDVDAAKNMETMLQYNADRAKLVKKIFQWLLDGQIYSVGIVRTLWIEEMARRRVWKQEPALGLLGMGMQPELMRQEEERMVYEGNEIINIDPFMFFPDPRVPMEEVNTRGEYVFWRTYEGKHTLQKAEAQGQLKWVEHCGHLPGDGQSAAGSVRNLISKGDAHAGMLRQNVELKDYVQVDQGTVDIIPADWGLGDGEEPERWIFTVLNKKQIVQAEPFDYDHGRHPVSVIEPNSQGYAFGQPSMVDMLGPIQDTLSWFINSHIHNVRNVINNMIVVDPSAVELQDLKDPRAGKIIRLKQSAIGRDVRTALQQLQVHDITRAHINDMQVFMRMGDTLSAVNDNLRGIQEAGGRKTATEVRTAGEAGGSRLSALARIISSQGMTDLAEQMSLNIQQFQSMEFYLEVVGEKGLEGPVPITPDKVAGDFYYPVHDGTLPLDRVALLDVWKEIWLAIASDPQLREEYNLGAIFEYVAELGGAKNISSFRVQVVPDAQQQGALNGGAVPVGIPGQAGGGGGGVPGPGAPASGPNSRGLPVNSGPGAY